MSNHQNLISNSPRPASRPSPLHGALEASLAMALATVDDGDADVNTLASGPRVALERRRRELCDALAPCGPKAVAGVLATLEGMAYRKEVDGAAIAVLVKQEIEDLQGYPEWALAAAARSYRLGELGEGHWRPTSGDLAKEAGRLVGPFHVELRRIGRLLDSPQLSAPARVRISAARWAALKAQIAELGGI